MSRIDPGTEAYIRREYDGEVEAVNRILNRHGVWNPVLALEIAGYYTGCMTVDGHTRSGRRGPQPHPG